MANGLINLQTDLKSLRYGSSAPYITKDINKSPLSDKIGIQASARIDDTSRIAQMLASKPGLKYLANEALLQQVNIEDKIAKARKSGKSVAGAILQQAGGTFVNTIKIAGSTLAQVPVNGTGTHFLKGFKTDTYLQPTGGDKPSKFAAFFGAGGVEGAPYALKGEIVPGIHKTELTNRDSAYNYDEYLNTPTGSSLSKINAQAGKQIPTYPKGSTLRETTAKNGDGGLIKSISNNNVDESYSLIGQQLDLTTSTYSEENTKSPNNTESNIISAQTGAPIPVQIGRDTTVQIGTLHDPTTVDPIEIGTAFELEKEKYKDDTYTGTDTQDNIGAVKQNSNITLSTNTDVDGFVQGARALNGVEQTGTVGSFEEGDANRKVTHQNSIRKEKRVRLGDQGSAGIPNTDFQKAKKANYYWVTDPDQIGVDIINTLEPSESPFDELGKDFAKFYFEIITPDGSQFLHFRAFIQSIDDGYTADWQGRKYNGRAENFYTYGGFDRDINVSFTIAAASRSELMPMYRKMIYLASATAPTYGDSGLMRGTLARLTIGSYFSHIPGVITSVKYTLDENAPWEIQLGKGTGKIDTDVQTLPMMLKCSISFKPIHDFAPQTGLYPYFTEIPEPVEDKAVIKTRKKPIPDPVPQQDSFILPKEVPVRAQESTGTAQTSKINTESEKAMKANNLIPKKTIEQIGIDYKKDLEESKKTNYNYIKY